MKGLTILNEKKVRKTSNWLLSVYCLLVVLMATIAIYGFINHIIIGSTLCSLAFFMWVFMVVAGLVDKVTQYECLIDKKTLDNNFIDTYQIVDKRGDIYIIEEINS